MPVSPYAPHRRHADAGNRAAGKGDVLPLTKALVDRLSSWSLYRRINGPAGLQLGTAPDSTPNVLGPVPAGVEVGVIAGNRSLNPLFSAWLTGSDDGKVAVASTHVANETAHLTLPYSHTWLMWRRPVLDAIRAFLRDGAFTGSAAS